MRCMKKMKIEIKSNDDDEDVEYTTFKRIVREMNLKKSSSNKNIQLQVKINLITCKKRKP